MGYITDQEKYSYYNVCKIVVIPSRWDCQPAALFEAAAYSKPVIASDASNPDVIMDGITGFVFKSEDVKDLEKKIAYLLKNKNIQEKWVKGLKMKLENMIGATLLRNILIFINMPLLILIRKKAIK